MPFVGVGSFLTTDQAPISRGSLRPRLWDYAAILDESLARR